MLDKNSGGSVAILRGGHGSKICAVILFRNQESGLILG
jgi:hypothetical protein